MVFPCELRDSPAGDQALSGEIDFPIFPAFKSNPHDDGVFGPVALSHLRDEIPERIEYVCRRAVFVPYLPVGLDYVRM